MKKIVSIRNNSDEGSIAEVEIRAHMKEVAILSEVRVPDYLLDNKIDLVVLPYEAKYLGFFRKHIHGSVLADADISYSTCEYAPYYRVRVGDRIGYLRHDLASTEEEVL